MSSTEANGQAAKPNDASGRGVRRRRYAWWLVAIVPVMFAFAFANIPLFRVWCEHEGINIAPRNVASTAVKNGRPVEVLFTGVVATGLPIEFEPARSFERVRVGQRSRNSFTFFNPTDKVVRFRAIHDIEPEDAAKTMAIIQCFCFSNQQLQPHQTKTLPVIYQVNPGLSPSTTQMTLNYTLFPQ